jgi:hypothetical protein
VAFHALNIGVSVIVRLYILAPLLLAGCDVDNDAANDHVSVNYDEQRIKKAAKDAGRVAKDVGSGVGNVASNTGRAIKNEVGDVDVDVDVRRKKNEENSSGAQ